MIDPSLLTARDFIGIRAALVSELGNDMNRAGVITRIYWRTQQMNRDTHERDGHLWWRATYQTLAEETGLTANQVRRIVPWLVEQGHVETQEFRLEGITDRTLSMRVILPMADSPVEMANPHSQGMADSPSLPSIKTREVSTLSSEVVELLDLLDAGIRANGARVPVRNSLNVNAMRLLIEKDKRSPDEIAHVIQWATTDSFWKSNILSAAKLREKYDQLRLKAQAQPAGDRGAIADQRVRDMLDRGRRLQEELDAMGVGRQ